MNWCYFILICSFFNCRSQNIVSGLIQKPKIACIGFYNLENLFDTENDTLINDEEFTPKGSKRWTENLYFDKLNNLASVIQGIGTELNSDGLAILGVCEIENRRVLEDLVKHEKLINRHYKIVHFNSPDERGIDVGLLYQNKYFTLLNASAHKLLLVDQNMSEKKTRDILLVKGKIADQNLFIMVNHWPSRRGGEAASQRYRMAAAQLVHTLSDSILLQDPKAQIIIMGDLNDNPNNRSLTEVLNAKMDSANLKTHEFYNPFFSDFNKGRGTTAFEDSWNVFDQILLSKNCLYSSYSFTYYKHEIYQKQFLLETQGLYKDYPKRTFSGNVYNHGYSDHFPVSVYFNYKQ